MEVQKRGEGIVKLFIKYLKDAHAWLLGWAFLQLKKGMEVSKCKDEDTCAHVSFIAIPIGPLFGE